jgi:hypothetical protein
MANYIGNQLSQGEFRKLDDISSSFNGSTTSFNLTASSATVIAGAATQLIISVNGVIQEPLVSYTLAQGGSQIQFTIAPPTGATFFGILFGGVGQVSIPADASVTTEKIADSAVTNAKIDTVAASKLTGALPAIDGSALTGIDALPTQTGHSGEYLTTDGTTASWAELNPNKTTYGMFENANTITANYSITSGNNAMTAGPITIQDGVSVLIPDGSVWTIV